MKGDVGSGGALPNPEWPKLVAPLLEYLKIRFLILTYL